MQLLNSGAKAQVTGVEHTQRFQMQMNAKMFSILTDKLYQNKEGAIIRELSANARDAHVEAGNSDKPFDITMPSWLSKEFKIRDYGTGIDPDLFYDTYTNLGHSTKDNENTSIGDYGLGSKTPFAVTESYSITNFWNGMAYVYTAFKDEGMPTVSLIGSHKTDEPNGLEVSVDTTNSDIFSNTEELKRQLKYFEVKPNIVGYDDFEWYVIPDLSKGFHVEKSSFNCYIEVVMGGIPYRIKDYRYEKLGIDDLINNSHFNIILVAELGEVDIPPSRESLEITKRTKMFLQTKIKSLSIDYEKSFKNKIKEAKNLVEVDNLLKKKISHWLPKNLSNEDNYNFKGTNYQLEELTSLLHSTIPNMVVKVMTKWRVTLATEEYLTNVRSMNTFLTQRMNTYGEDIKKCGPKAILNDLSPRLAAIIRDKKSLFGKTTLFVSPTERKIKNFKEASDKLKTTLEMLGFTTVRLSTLITIDNKKVSGTKRKVKPNQIWRVMDNGTVDKDLPVMKMPKDGYYVPMSNWATDTKWTELKYIVSVMKKEVFALRSDAEREVKESKVLKPVTDLSKLIKNELILRSKEDAQTAVNKETLQNILPNEFFDNKIYKIMSDKPKSKLKDLILACHEASEMRDEKFMSRWQRRMVENLEIKVKPAKHKIPVRILKLAEHAKENYAALLTIVTHGVCYHHSYNDCKDEGINQVTDLIIGQFK
jgi:hypothetical protein